MFCTVVDAVLWVLAKATLRAGEHSGLEGKFILNLSTNRFIYFTVISLLFNQAFKWYRKLERGHLLFSR